MHRKLAPTEGANADYDAFAKLDLEPIIYSLVARPGGVGWSLKLARLVEGWYRNFLYLCARYPNVSLVPTEAIDEFWHAHILDTLKYQVDCQILFGGYLHHFPYLGLRDEQDKLLLQAAFSSTLELFRRHFDSDPVMDLKKIGGPLHLAEPSPAVCAGACAGTIEKMERDWPRPVLSGGQYVFSAEKA